MTIEEFVRVKEDLEVELLNLIDEKVQAFQEATGTIVSDVNVTMYSYDASNFAQWLKVNKVSDVDVSVVLKAREG